MESGLVVIGVDEAARRCMELANERSPGNECYLAGGFLSFTYWAKTQGYSDSAIEEIWAAAKSKYWRKINA